LRRDRVLYRGYSRCGRVETDTSECYDVRRSRLQRLLKFATAGKMLGAVELIEGILTVGEDQESRSRRQPKIGASDFYAHRISSLLRIFNQLSFRQQFGQLVGTGLNEQRPRRVHCVADECWHPKEHGSALRTKLGNDLLFKVNCPG